MTTIVGQAERPRAVAGEERGGRRWPGRWSMGAIGLALGVGLGIALTVVSVILPRSRELARWRQGSDFFRDFSLQEVLETAAPGKAWSVDSQSDWSPWANRSSGREFLARTTLPPGEQSRLFPAILAQVQGMIQRRDNGQVFNSGPATAPAPPGGGQATRPANRTEHGVLSYTIGESSGSIHVWAVGSGDDYTIIFTLHEN